MKGLAIKSGYRHTKRSFKSKIAIKVSGGLDSAGVSYMIFKTIHEQNLDVEVVVVTTNYDTKPYQVEFSAKVIKWLLKEFPSVKVIDHITNVRSGDMDYSDTQDIILNQAYNNGCADWPDHTGVQRHYMGLTHNPPEEVHEQFDHYGAGTDPILYSRQGVFDQYNNDPCHPGYRPFINTDKKGVAEIYNQFNLMEPGSLFDQTRSCEAYTYDFSSHCGKCWFCKERVWGCGKLQ